MDLFFRKLMVVLRPVLEAHSELSLEDAKIRPPTHDQDKTVGVGEFKCGNVFVRIVQVDDKGKLFNAEFIRDKMTRSKLTHLSPETLIDFIVRQVEASGKADYLDRSYAKGLEPLSPFPDRENLRGGMPEPDSDKMEQWDAKAEYSKNLVQTFSRGEVKEEPSKTPKKVYRKDGEPLEEQSPEKGKTSWGGVSRLETKPTDEDNLPVRLSEAINGKVLCNFGYPHGVQFLDKEIYDEVMSKKLKPSWNAETAMIEYIPASRPTVRPSFKPRTIILRNHGKAQ